MHIGVCRLTFHLPANNSLKGKRQVSRSLISRLQQRFNVSVAEVDGIDQHRTLVIGVSCVSNDGGHAAEMIDAAVRFASGQRLDAELVDVERDVLPGL